MKKRFVLISLMVALSAALFAHTALLMCYDNGDGTISCEGGFSDGSSAAGVEVRVEDRKGKVLIKGEFDEKNEYSFKKPAGKFVVVMDAGPGHIVKKQSKDIK